MTQADISKFNDSTIRATLADGRTLVGHLHEAAQTGLYTVQANPTRFGVIHGGFVESFSAQQFAKIEAYLP